MKKLDESKLKNKSLLEKLQSIRKQEGIIGYVLRNSKTASIDLEDPKKIIEYAILSSTANEVGQGMTKTLQIGEVEDLILMSKTTKVLSKNVKDQQVTLFMEKNIDHKKLSKILQ
jgi:hypothetical protein